jgi:hypothetical protein
VDLRPLAARTSACRVQALQASGQFVGAELYRVDLPQQGRLKIRKKPTGSARAAGKLIADAASLLLPPMQQSFDYSSRFDVECRGRSMSEWRHGAPSSRPSPCWQS